MTSHISVQAEPGTTMEPYKKGVCIHVQSEKMDFWVGHKNLKALNDGLINSAVK